MAYSWSTPIINPVALGDKGALEDDKITHLDHKEVPASWFSGDNYKVLRWNYEELQLPKEPNALLFGTLRGKDIPNWADPPLKIKSVTCTNPPSYAVGTMVLAQGANSTMHGTGQDTPVEGSLRWKTNFDSQLPSLTIEYRQGPSKTDYASYRMMFFGNKTMENASYYSPAAIQSDPTSLSIPPHHQQAAKDGRLMAIKLQFGDVPTKDNPKVDKRWLDSIITLHGESKDRWQSPDAMNDYFRKVDFNTCPLFEKTMQRMFALENVSITLFRECKMTEAPNFVAWAAQYEYWQYVMGLATTFGPFWWYAMQPRFAKGSPGAQFARWEKPSQPPPVPWWLVKSFRAHVSEGVLKKLEPIEFEAVVQDPKKSTNNRCYLPSRDYAALLHELSLLRERAFQAMIATSLFDGKREHESTALFLKNAEKDTWWRIEINANIKGVDNAQDGGGEKILPQANSIVNVTFRYGQKQKVSVRGRVVEIVDKPKNVDLVVHCLLTRAESDDMKKHKSKDQTTGERTPGMATLRVRVDYTSIDRTISALRGMVANKTDALLAQEHEKHGPRPDVRHLLLNYKPRSEGAIRGLPDVMTTFSEYVKSVGHDESGNPDSIYAYFGSPGLNDSQKKSIVAAINGGKGNLAVIHGPPGTGKSTTLACLVLILKFVFGARICVATPSNAAADAIMDKVVETSRFVEEKRGKVLKIVRYLTLSGTPIQGDVRKQVGPEGFEFDPLGFDEIGLAQRDLWKSHSKLAGFALHERKKQAATQFAANPSAPKEAKEACTEWLSMLTKAAKGLLFGEPRKVFKKADEMLTSHVLRKADVLIGSLNSMGRELTEDFAANTIIVDEAAQASLPEIAIPFVTFKANVVRAVTAGDHLQLQAFLASARSNETAPYTTISSFQEQHESGLFAVHMLNVQYRCHPNIYAWSNSTFYGNNVRPFGALKDVQPIDRTVAQFLEKNIGHVKDADGKLKWNSDPNKWPRLIVVDVNAMSDFYPGSTSWYNLYEVEFVKWLRNCLLEASVPDRGVQINATDITMISPYTGQCQALKDMVKESKHQGGIVSTVAKAQGGECTIGISTFARNNPNKLIQVGFVTTPALLNVWFSRQKRFHFVLGNFIARDKERAILASTKRGDQKEYVSLHSSIVDGTLEGMILLQPRDFIGWTGWPSYLPPAIPPKSQAGPTPPDQLDITNQPGREVQESMPLDRMMQGLGFGSSSGSAQAAPPTVAAATSSRQQSTVCFKCFEFGHTIPNCPNKGMTQAQSVERYHKFRREHPTRHVPEPGKGSKGGPSRK